MTEEMDKQKSVQTGPSGNTDPIPRPFADARELERLWAALERDPDYRPWWVIK